MVWQDYWTGPEQQPATPARPGMAPPWTESPAPPPPGRAPQARGRGIPPWVVVVAVVVVGVLALALVQRATARRLGPAESSARLLPYVAPSTGGAFKAIFTRSDGAPVRWSPCKPIHWVYRPTGEPQYGRATVTEAVAALQAATGLQFVFDGDTAEEPSVTREAESELYPGRYAPVLVAWATPEEVARFDGDAIGLARPLVAQGQHGGEEIVSGWAYVSTAGPLFTRQGTVLHELAHVLGLDHVDAPGELMRPYATGMSALGPGDLAGLSFMGQGPCHGDSAQTLTSG